MTGEIHLSFHAKRDRHPGGPGSQLCTSTACLADIGREPHKIMLATDDDRDKDLTRIRAMVAEAANDHCAAVIPARHDLETMARWAAREEADLIVVPGTWAHPSMAERLRGHVLARLTDHTHVPVAVYEADGSSWLANAAAVHA